MQARGGRPAWRRCLCNTLLEASRRGMTGCSLDTGGGSPTLVLAPMGLRRERPSNNTRRASRSSTN
eukprot:13918156-Alexandrium_andersonii.AAC.1